MKKTCQVLFFGIRISGTGYSAAGSRSILPPAVNSRFPWQRKVPLRRTTAPEATVRETPSFKIGEEAVQTPGESTRSDSMIGGATPPWAHPAAVCRKNASDRIHQGRRYGARGFGRRLRVNIKWLL